MKTKIILGLVLGGLVLSTACSSRQIDSGIYQTNPGGATEDASAADRAETAVVKMDSTRMIILNDSLQNSAGEL
ncbi:MAG: hypothetical protein JWQ14_1698 [Adhaeribacter sp.]|nr:hypothetical protein [Adhaeribacter sp.]